MAQINIESFQKSSRDAFGSPQKEIKGRMVWVPRVGLCFAGTMSVRMRVGARNGEGKAWAPQLGSWPAPARTLHNTKPREGRAWLGTGTLAHMAICHRAAVPSCWLSKLAVCTQQREERKSSSLACRLQPCRAINGQAGPVGEERRKGPYVYVSAQRLPPTTRADGGSGSGVVGRVSNSDLHHAGADIYPAAVSKKTYIQLPKKNGAQ